jgi:homoserine dehydrogenase
MSVGLNSFQTSGNSPGHRESRCHVGLLGYGTVGAVVARRLTGTDSVPPLLLTHICDRRARDKQAREAAPLNNLTWVERVDDLLAADVDIIVEALPRGEPAVDAVRAALLAGKSVVTASRQVMAHHGPALLTLAERQGRQLRYEAAAGGAMPIVRALAEGLGGDRVLKVEAILNGTTNAVLSQMEHDGCTMDEAIAAACAHGYAEADPTVDLDGGDAAAKLAILCALAFGLRVAPDAIDARSTKDVTLDDLRRARQRGGTIRQVAHASYARPRGTLTAWVAPTFVPGSSLLARAEGAHNAAIVTCQYAGEVTFTGAGAGGDAIAVALIGDMRAIARDRAAIVPAPMLSEPHEIKGLSERTFAEAV